MLQPLVTPSNNNIFIQAMYKTSCYDETLVNIYERYLWSHGVYINEV